MDGWMDGWMDGCMHVWMYVYIYICMYVCMYVSIYIYIYKSTYTYMYILHAYYAEILYKYMLTYQTASKHVRQKQFSIVSANSIHHMKDQTFYSCVKAMNLHIESA